MTTLDQFLRVAAGEVRRRAALAPHHRDIIIEGATAFQAAVDTAAIHSAELSKLPVLESAASIDPAHTTNPVLTSLAISATSQVPWVPTPRLLADDGGTVALGLIDAVRDFGDMTCGVMLLAPGAAYPEHSHPPQEVYLPIAGSGQWRFGGADNYIQLSEDALVYNNPGDLHGVIASDEPELALYFLWS